ncbi:MAG: response regulator transcription factor [Clostridia bacterium]|nr:response regulator transcription factor [Clostridia bacterium]
MYKILFADDETKIRETVKDYMTAKGLDVILAENGKRAVEYAENGEFDLIILDVMMPVRNGLDACREIRSFCSTPIIFLSALGEEHDLLGGYGSGADDYIVKPFPLSVLYQKCVATITRSKGLDRKNRLTVSGITLDKNTMKIHADGRKITLASKDFQLLEYLMINKNTVLSRSLILSRIWGYDFEGDDRVVDTHIKIIRKALGKNAACIKTVIGSGYCFEEV